MILTFLYSILDFLFYKENIQYQGDIGMDICPGPFNFPLQTPSDFQGCRFSVLICTHIVGVFH